MDVQLTANCNFQPRTLKEPHAAQFQVKHLMISDVRGDFSKMIGKITFDGKNYSTVQVEASIDVTSIDVEASPIIKGMRGETCMDAQAI